MRISSLPYDRYAQEQHRRPRGKNAYRISSQLGQYPKCAKRPDACSVWVNRVGFVISAIGPRSALSDGHIKFPLSVSGERVRMKDALC
jgi:hypothetical protein